MKVTFESYRRVFRKDPAGRRTWWFAIQVPKRQPITCQAFGNFPEAKAAAIALAEQEYKLATEIVVLIP